MSDFLQEYSHRTSGNGFKIEEGRLRLGIRNKFFTEAAETLEHVTQKSIQGEVGCSFGQLGLRKMSPQTAGELK